MRGRPQSPRCLTVPQAAHRLGVEPAAVHAFVRLRLLRTASAEPLAVVGTDVARLQRVLERRAGPGPVVGARRPLPAVMAGGLASRAVLS